MTEPMEKHLLDAEAWDSPDRLTEEEWRLEAGPDWRRAPGKYDLEGDDE